MTELKLTEQQIEQAAKAMMASWAPSLSWEDADDYRHEDYRKMVRAAAPYLQVPIEEPTSDELIPFQGKFEALRQFVRRRNAARQPKADPRREKIKAVLAAEWNVNLNEQGQEKLADAILAALEERN